MTFGVSVVGILFLSTSSWEKAAINTNIQYSTDHKIKLPNTLLYLWYKPRSGGNLIDDVGCYIGCPVSSKFILTISGHTLNTASLNNHSKNPLMKSRNYCVVIFSVSRNLKILCKKQIFIYCSFAIDIVRNTRRRLHATQHGPYSDRRKDLKGPEI